MSPSRYIRIRGKMCLTQIQMTMKMRVNNCINHTKYEICRHFCPYTRYESIDVGDCLISLKPLIHCIVVLFKFTIHGQCFCLFLVLLMCYVEPKKKNTSQFIRLYSSAIVLFNLLRFDVDGIYMSK